MFCLVCEKGVVVSLCRNDSMSIFSLGSGKEEGNNN